MFWSSMQKNWEFETRKARNYERWTKFFFQNFYISNEWLTHVQNKSAHSIILKQVFNEKLKWGLFPWGRVLGNLKCRIHLQACRRLLITTRFWDFVLSCFVPCACASLLVCIFLISSLQASFLSTFHPLHPSQYPPLSLCPLPSLQLQTHPLTVPDRLPVKYCQDIAVLSHPFYDVEPKFRKALAGYLWRSEMSQKWQAHGWVLLLVI